MLKSFLNFDEMITPKIITIIYWLGIIGVVIGGLMAIGTSITFGGSILAGLFSGLCTIVFGVIGVRISCELIILSFNIYGKLREIAENTAVK
ncbi:DUF4282 domain-containing protein [Tatumella sp. TA1]|uniref:DUF4282 domain-containing protein n=1 Tax=Rosenbergiella collisarenosi TaxID=1544695 RepID=UPI0008F951F5|nr:DUF4282 domain-containing protein [Rosenbergiella collisarenosi]MBT0721740.1 DUF4282 domain-containing protein [Rosenbergiella collisarenosi]QGX92877.1 DUF4282 domain-containing protein [Tatumella sp. TA1]